MILEKQVKLGKSEVTVYPIGLGSNAIGGHNIHPNLDEDVGKEVVRTALQNGVNFIDTAYMYGPKRSEELIGQVVKEFQRDDVILATKAAHKYIGDKVLKDNSPNFLKQAVDEALLRLQTDYLDLFYIHYPDDDTPKAEAIGALKDLKDAGKIRAIGVSNFSLEQLKDANQDGYVDVFQGEYNLLNRSAEKDYFPYMIENKISFIPYFPLASGLLTGKFDKNSTFTDNRSKKPAFQGETFIQNLEKIEKLKEIAASYEEQVANVVLAWYLTQPSVDAVIPGAKRPEQVAINKRAGELSLTQEDIQKINQIFSSPDSKCP